MPVLWIILAAASGHEVGGDHAHEAEPAMPFETTTVRQGHLLDGLFNLQVQLRRRQLQLPRMNALLVQWNPSILEPGMIPEDFSTNIWRRRFGGSSLVSKTISLNTGATLLQSTAEFGYHEDDSHPCDTLALGGSDASLQLVGFGGSTSTGSGVDLEQSSQLPAIYFQEPDGPGTGDDTRVAYVPLAPGEQVTLIEILDEPPHARFTRRRLSVRRGDVEVSVSETGEHREVCVLPRLSVDHPRSKPTPGKAD